jgi:hypothetical protein
LLSEGGEGKINMTRRVHLSFARFSPGITTERSEVVIIPLSPLEITTEDSEVLILK